MTGEITRGFNREGERGGEEEAEEKKRKMNRGKEENK
jgi:hypothetical protein